jgi:hypothetical protein
MATERMEISAVLAQMEHPSYQKTTKKFQENTMNYLVKNLSIFSNNNFSVGDSYYQEIQDRVNAQNKNYRLETTAPFGNYNFEIKNK